MECPIYRHFRQCSFSLNLLVYIVYKYQLLRICHKMIDIDAEPDICCLEDNVSEANQINLPNWVIERLKQDNADVSQAVVDMVIWVDRVKCWMYQADAELAHIIEDVGAIGSGVTNGSNPEPKSVVPKKKIKPTG